jgi:hypothetical protein
MSDPVWGTMPAQPTQKPASDVTAGSKGKIIMSQNVVTRKGIEPQNGGAPQSMEK